MLVVFPCVCGTIHSPRSGKWVVFFNPLRHWIDIHFPTSKSGSLCALLARSDIACVCTCVCAGTYVHTCRSQNEVFCLFLSRSHTRKKPPYIMCSTAAVRSMFSSTPDGTREAQKNEQYNQHKERKKRQTHERHPVLWPVPRAYVCVCVYV